jgi:putative hydrolase of the HAD superfamily
MLKAILFDLDDTLIDWGDFAGDWERIERPHLTKVYEYLCRIDDPTGDLDDFEEAYFRYGQMAWLHARNTMIAPHLGQILVKAAEEIGVPGDALDVEECLRVYDWSAVPGTSPFPDAREGLAMLRDRGIRFGIVTNAYQPMWLRDTEMAEHGLLDFFPECRFSAADVGVVKPHSDIFNTALECLGTSPEETIFIGDNPVADIAGAQAAGMQAVLRVNHHSRPLLSGLVVPDGAINTLMELPAILDDWFPGWGNGAK